MIVSASRRCDLIAYRMEWLMARLGEGFCEVRNPFDASSVRRISLLPENLDCLVLWTRDPRPLLPHIEELEARGIRFYVQVTLTGYPPSLEPGAPRPGAILPAMRALAERIGPGRLVWRYDPIFLAASRNRSLPDVDVDFHRKNFESLAREVEGSSRRVVVSLLDEYRNTGLRLGRAGYVDPVYGTPRDGAGSGISGTDSSQPELFQKESPTFARDPYAALLADIAGIARSRGLEARSCAEPTLRSRAGIEAGACIDAGLIAELFGREIEAGRDKGQRPGCRCAPSVDIGEYGPCPTGCVYCYARR